MNSTWTKMKNVVTCADKDNIGESKGVMVVNKEKTR